MRSRFGLLVVGLLLGSQGVVCASEPPVAVSPGRADTGAVVESRCPTFNWGSVPGAESYELVVYQVAEHGADTKPVLRKSFPGSVDGWTPAMDLCLERGGQFAWSVRALSRKGASEWSVPGLFRVAAAPSRAEFTKAVETVRRYIEALEADKQTSASDLLPDSGEAHEPHPAHGLLALEAAAFQISGSVAPLTVAGEVRTVDPSGDPRVWGRGRPGGSLFGVVGGYCNRVGPGIKYGLTEAVADWGSAAEACPAGSWLCAQTDLPPTPFERACQTGRRGTVTNSYHDCDGTIRNRPDDEHVGWLADTQDWDVGLTLREGGDIGQEKSCRQLPVWCCLE